MSNPDTSRALVFANGDASDGAMVRRALAAGAGGLMIAADGGTRVAAHYDVSVHVVIGDMDSIDADALERLAQAGAEVRRFPAEKDETDLELALLLAAERGARWLRIIGGVGDRLDQTLSNIYLMALPALADADVRIVAGLQETRLLTPGTWTIEGEPGDTVSLVPLSGDVGGVVTDALAYPLRDETLAFGPARGVSNVMHTHQARVSFRDGILLLIHTLGRA